MELFIFNTIFLIFLKTLVGCHGDSTVSVKFVRYENSRGKIYSGSCCDGKWGICQQNGCDHYFSICLDNINSGDSVMSCLYGDVITGTTKNQNVIQFGTFIRSTHNPVEFFLPGPLPGSLAIKVRVADKDKYSEDDFVDYLRKEVTSVNKRLNTNLILQRKTWLELQLWVNCSKGFYGSRCETHCPKPTNHDHYVCDVITGQKICQPGWVGEDCNEAPCEDFKCSNNGTCHVTAHGRPLCVCTEDYTGTHCETHRCTITCRPGTCIELNQPDVKYICKCQADNGTFVFEQKCSLPEETSTPVTSKLWNNDCSSIVKDRTHGPANRGKSGIYQIHPPGGDAFKVYCDMTSSAEGWTAIQRRLDGTEDFFRGWDDYKKGFGNFENNSEYWLGLEKIRRLTSSKDYRLRIDMVDYYGDLKYADYGSFFIDGEDKDYTLHVKDYSGDAGDALGKRESDTENSRYQNGMAFSTYDHDMDTSQHHNCAELFESGWWFSSCFRSNLNGVYRNPTGDARCCAYKDRCVTWQTIDRMSLRSVEMKIIPIS